MKAQISNVVNTNREKLQNVIPLEFPYSIFIDVTNICNFKCKFCALQYSNKEHNFKKTLMSYENFMKIADDIKTFKSPLRMLRLSALGEPLLNKDLPKMIKYAKENQISNFIEIISNGSLLNGEMGNKLSTAGLNRVRISIEGISSKDYELMSSYKMDWDCFIQNLKDFYENKGSIEVYIKTVDAAVPDNASKETFFNTFGDLCDKISIERVIPTWSNYTEIKNEFSIEKSKGLYNQSIRDVSCCPFPFYSCVINPDGEVTACCSDWERKISFGNALDTSIVEIWRGKEYQDFLKGMLQKGRRINHPKGCGMCEHPNYDDIDNIDDYVEEILSRYI